MQNVDVAIIGGGPAGSAAAITLRKRDDISVAVIERGDYTNVKVGESLSPGARGLLQYLGLWERFEQEQRLSLLGTEASWGSDRLGTMDFILTLHGAGWALDRRRFEEMMAERAQVSGATLLKRSKVSACEYDGARWHLDIDGRAMTARYVIDAAGRTSPFSLGPNVHRQRNDTLTAVTARLPRADGCSQMTRVEAIADGWWYASPLPSGETIVCLFSDASRIHSSRLADPDTWAKALGKTRYISALVKPRCYRPDRLHSTAAFSSLLSGHDDRRPMIAAGDAIAARDPLSSSGIPNAMGSGIQAARVAADWLFGKGELGAAYLDSVSQDHFAYLKTHWQTYRTETRWPTAPFWAFRAAKVSRRPETVVRARPDGVPSIFVPARISKLIQDTAQTDKPLVDVVTQLRHTCPDIPDERLILAVEDLTAVVGTTPDGRPPHAMALTSRSKA